MKVCSLQLSRELLDVIPITELKMTGKLKLDSEYIVTLKPNNPRFRHSGVVLVF